jgi:hypothetical protein
MEKQMKMQTFKNLEDSGRGIFQDSGCEFLTKT